MPIGTDSNKINDNVQTQLFDPVDVKKSIALARSLRESDRNGASVLYLKLLESGEVHLLGEYIDFLLKGDEAEKQTAYLLLIGSSASGDYKNMGRLAKYLGATNRNSSCECNDSIIYWYSKAIANGASWLKKEYAEFLLSINKDNKIFEISGIDRLFINNRTRCIVADSNLSDNIVKVTLPDQFQGTNCKFVLSSRGTTIDVKYSKNFVEFVLKESGIYQVSLSSKVLTEANTELCTMPIVYYKQADIEECEKFIANCQNVSHRPSRYYSSNYPELDFIVWAGDYCLEGVQIDGFRVQEHVIGSHKYCIAAPTDSGTDLFSGYYFIGDSLVFGIQEYLEHNNVEMEEQIGQFTVVQFNESNIKICNDYFGFGKIYYYNNGDDWIISNRYHLIAYLLSNYYHELKIDKSVLKSILFQYKGILSDQPINSQLIIENTYFVQLGHYLVLDDKGVRIKENSMTSLIDKITEYDYDDLLEKSAHDLISNVKACINSDRFSHYVADLTGGMDSRLTFASLSNVCSGEDVFFRSGGNVKEVICASNMVQDFNYHYDKDYMSFEKIKRGCNLPKARSITFDDYLDLIISLDFGHYDPSKLFSLLRYNGCLHLTGFAGEPISRPYMSSHVFGVTDESTIDDIVNHYIFENTKNIMLGDSKNVAEYSRLLKESLLNNYGDNLYKKSEGMLLNYRSRFHFDSIARNSNSTTIITPLMSKNSLFAFYQSLNSSSYRYIFDLMDKLNSDIAKYRYESLSDNIQSLLHHGINHHIVYPEKITDDYNETLEVVKQSKYDFSGTIIDKWDESSLLKITYDRLIDDYIILMKKLPKQVREQIKMPLWIEIQKLSVIENSQAYSNELYGVFKKLETIKVILCNVFDTTIYNISPIIIEKDPDMPIYKPISM